MGNKLQVLSRQCAAGARTLTGVLWGPGGLSSEEAAGGQCETLHFNCRQGKIPHSKLETRQMSFFPWTDPRNGCIWKTLWLETLPCVQRFVGFASPIKETFAKPSPTVSHGHGLIVHVQRVLVLCQAVRSDFQPYFTTVKGGAREGGLNSPIPLDSITFWHGCIPWD